MKNTPPKLFLGLLELFCPPQLHEGIEGDLVEQFYIDSEKRGAWNSEEEIFLERDKILQARDLSQEQVHNEIN